MPPPGSAHADRHRKAHGPSRLSGPLAGVFIILGGVFGYLLYRLIRWGQASEGSAHAVTVSAADVLLLGAGAVGCWVIAGVLLRWGRSSR